MKMIFVLLITSLVCGKVQGSDQSLKVPKNALKVPLVAQTTDYTCGVASLTSVLYYYNLIEYGEMDLAKIAHSDPKEGTSPQNIVKTAKKIGFKALYRENLTIQDLKNSLANKIPVIVDIQAWYGSEVKDWKKIWNSGHYVVAIAVDSQNIYFMDPSFPSYYGFIPHQEFLDRWHDFDTIKGKKVVNQNAGIFIWGKEPRKVLYEEARKIE